MSVFIRCPYLNWLTLAQDHPTISFNNIDQTSSRQFLAVPFDVPHVHVLHTVRMHPLRNPAGPFLQRDCLATGSVLRLQVVISHTRNWWDGDARSRYNGKPLEFRYEVQALADDWTIGGQKKGHFSAKVSYQGNPIPIVTTHNYGRRAKIQASQFSSCHNERAT